MKKSGIQSKTTFSVTCRAELVDEEVVQLLREMNVTTVSMGLESGSERILRELKGGGASVAKNICAVRLLEKQGIQPIGSFCIGSPQETEADLKETFRCIKELPLAKVGVFILTPLPGTDLWESAKQTGQVSDDMNWDNLAMDPKHTPNKIIIASQIPREVLLRWYYRIRRLALFKAIWAKAKRFLKDPASLPVSARRRMYILKDHITKRFFPETT
jgi:radical SAM superfamily enzyme YgiQ (UPF0313 family)